MLYKLPSLLSMWKDKKKMLCVEFWFFGNDKQRIRVIIQEEQIWKNKEILLDD